MPSFEELKAKYQPVIDVAKQNNIRLDHVHQDGQTGKLVLGGGAPSERMVNRVWNKIKEIDSAYSDLSCQLTLDSTLSEPVRTHTVASGDSLWKIAKVHLGDGNRYPEIIAANPGKLVDATTVIHPGDVLVVPDLD